LLPEKWRALTTDVVVVDVDVSGLAILLYSCTTSTCEAHPRKIASVRFRTKPTEYTPADPLSMKRSFRGKIPLQQNTLSETQGLHYQRIEYSSQGRINAFE
jgi:hypothetical protein